MALKLRQLVLSLAAVSAIIYAISLFPPLGSGDGRLLPGMTAAELAEAVQIERDYCTASSLNVDCGCFSSKSGLVRAAAGPRIPGLIYADPKKLARSQAKASC